MREGPLAELFRATEAAQRQAEGSLSSSVPEAEPRRAEPEPDERTVDHVPSWEEAAPRARRRPRRRRRRPGPTRCRSRPRRRIPAAGPIRSGSAAAEIRAPPSHAAAGAALRRAAAGAAGAAASRAARATRARISP